MRYWSRVDQIRLADHAPELLEGLDASAKHRARDTVVAQTLSLAIGPWTPDVEQFNSAVLPDGALVIAGFLSRRVSVGNRTSLELIGPGDLLRPWVGGSPGGAIAADVEWEVHDRVKLALLDREFAECVAAWPPITTALMDRLVLRSRWLSFHLAVCAQRGIERRVLLLLWHLGDRWGIRESDGVYLPAPLKHELIAAAVGAARQTVTTAVAALQRAGRVSRRAGGTWLLHGNPPPELRRGT